MGGPGSEAIQTIAGHSPSFSLLRSNEEWPLVVSLRNTVVCLGSVSAFTGSACPTQVKLKNVAVTQQEKLLGEKVGWGWESAV